MATIHEAIQALRPEIGFTMYDDDPKTIIWDDENIITPSDAEIKAKYNELVLLEKKKLTEKEIKKTELLKRLGITEDEAKLLLA